MKPGPETPAEYNAFFKALLSLVLTVPREEMQQREAEYLAQSKLVA